MTDNTLTSTPEDRTQQAIEMPKLHQQPFVPVTSTQMLIDQM